MIQTFLSEEQFRETLCCPLCLGALIWEKEGAQCPPCKRRFPKVQGVPNFLMPPLDELVAKNPFGVVDFWNTRRETWFGGPDCSAEGMDDHGERFLVPCKGTVLDVGCGKGPASDCAVDIFIPKPRVTNFILADAEHLPFKAKSYDVVHSSFVIEHTLRPADFILSLCRIARSRVVLTTDNGEWLGILAFRLLNRGFLFHEEHMHLWPHPYLQNLCRRLGLEAKIDLLNCSRTWFTRWLAALGKIPRFGVCCLNTIRVDIRLSL